MVFIWWKLKWVTTLPILIRFSSCCLPFVFYSFICAPTTAFTWLSKFCTYNSVVFFYLSCELSWCRVSFLKGDLQFTKNFKNTICIGLCKLKCTEKSFIPFTLSIFSLSLFPIHNLKVNLKMPPGMYSTIHLLEIMRLSAFKSPLFYPSS